jgi:signal transduction histidine kinase
LTTINVQAGVAAHLLDRDPGHVRSALASIEDASRDALDELRAVVGVLRERDAGSAPLQPAPNVEAIGELVERARAAGQEVRLDIHGERPERVPDAVGLAAFRIVQESLTNARRHAAGAPASVRLSFRPDRLVVVVENSAGPTGNGGGDGGGNGDARGPEVVRSFPSAPPGARVPGSGEGGVGVIGMKERAAAVGGALEVGHSGHGFRVAAELPFRRGSTGA